MKTSKGATLGWTAINGINTLTFSPIAKGDTPAKMDVQGGSIIGSGASTTIRYADLKWPVQ